MRRIAILDAPSNLGLRPPTVTSVPGCAKAPGALRDHGLLERLHARDAGCLTPPRYDPGDWRPGDGVCHAEQINGYSRRLADRIADILDAGEFPVILGGDCSIVIGSGLAMHRLGSEIGGRIGLVFVDGHSDFRHPGNASYVGAAAGEDLALVTGRGQPDLAAIEGRRPYYRDIDVVVMGIRAQDEYRLDLQAAGIVTRPVPALRAEGAARSAQWARDQLVDCAGYWVHVDMDVLDPAVMPAVDAPSPGGIAFPELELLLAGLVDTPDCLGVEITVFDPDYDHDGSYAAEIVSTLVAGLSPLRTAPARPDLVAARQDLAEPPATDSVTESAAAWAAERAAADPVAELAADPVAVLAAADPVAGLTAADPVAGLAAPDPVADAVAADPVVADLVVDPAGADSVAEIDAAEPTAGPEQGEAEQVVEHDDLLQPAEESEPADETVLADEGELTDQAELRDDAVLTDEGELTDQVELPDGAVLVDESELADQAEVSDDAVLTDEVELAADTDVPDEVEPADQAEPADEVDLTEPAAEAEFTVEPAAEAELTDEPEPTDDEIKAETTDDTIEPEPAIEAEPQKAEPEEADPRLEPVARLNGNAAVVAEPVVPRPLGSSPLLDSEPLPATRPGMLRPRAPEDSGFSLPVQRPAFDLGSGEPAELA